MIDVDFTQKFYGDLRSYAGPVGIILTGDRTNDDRIFFEQKNGGRFTSWSVQDFVPPVDSVNRCRKKVAELTMVYDIT